MKSNELRIAGKMAGWNIFRHPILLASELYLDVIDSITKILNLIFNWGYA